MSEEGETAVQSRRPFGDRLTFSIAMIVLALAACGMWHFDETFSGNGTLFAVGPFLILWAAGLVSTSVFWGHRALVSYGIFLIFVLWGGILDIMRTHCGNAFDFYVLLGYVVSTVILAVSFRS